MKNTVYIRLVWYLILTLLPVSGIKVHAAFNPDAYIFTYLTLENGMAQNTVDYIYRDSRGFMWFATWNGLNRFDGYGFIRYDTQSKENAINSLFVRALVEDYHNQLWVGTEDGVNVIDIYSGEVKRFDTYPFAGNRIFTGSVNTLMKDTKGRIWIGFSDGLAIVSLDNKGDIAAIDMLEEGPESNVYILYQDITGKVWIGYRNGIRIANGVSEKVIQFEQAPGSLQETSFGEVFAFFPEGDKMWIGTSSGLVRYDKKNKTHTVYTNDLLNSRSLLQNYVKDIAMDRDGNLLLATFKGLCIYNKGTNDFTHIVSSPERAGGLNNNFVNSLYVDPSGMIWIGTEKGGINKMIKKDVMFNLYRHDNKQPSSLSPNPVNAIYEDSNRNIWIGTVEGGLNKRTDPAGKFKHFRHDPNDPYSLTHNAVSVITEGGGYLWVGTWGGGVDRMELTREGLFEHTSDLIRSGAFVSSFISGIVYDPAWHALWIGTRDGLDFYDLNTEAVIQVLHKDRQINLVSGIYLDRSDRLWAGTENGLFCITAERSDNAVGHFNVQHCPLTTSINKTFPHEKISCIFQSEDNTLWFGSNGSGLYKLTGREDDRYVFKNYGTEVGFSDNVIYAIEEDELGYLWLSTNMGLSSFCPANERANTFYASDGLSTNQFYWAASCHTSDGKLLFGNMDGAVIFDPSEMERDTTQLTVSITGGKLYNEPVNYNLIKDGWNLKERDRSFSIEFSSLYYHSPEKIKYMYMLAGFDTDWTIATSNRRFANYTNLPAGKYEFKVRSTNPDGEWSGYITSLPVRVIPPFYKTPWFIGFLVLFVILLLYYINEMRIRNLQRQKRQLEVMVNERTQEIESQKNRLAIQAKDLEEANEKLNQATQDKISFFTNITHEFKTPLTLILGPIEQALKLSHNPKVIDQLKLVRKNSNFLLSLINQLMDFRKVDSGSMKVNKTAGNFEEFVHSLILPFHILINGRNILVEERYHLSEPVFRFDPDLMQKILVNLLSNAVKFTPDNGSIHVYVSMLENKATRKKRLYLSVNDSGPGIPPDERDQIFNRFYQIENQTIYPVYGQSGTGIGLFLCKQIIELLKGSITVKENKSGGKGASFRILIPIEPEDVQTGNAYYMETDDGDSYNDEETEETPDKPLLLIVEDNSDMRIFIKSVLESNFRIIEAPNGDVALKKTIKHLPDFIVADIMMPVMDGLEFCMKVKNNFATSHIPILLLTAKSSTEVRIEGYRAGADGYIAKPFDAELLVARINNILEGKSRMHKAFNNSMDVKSLDIEEESQDRKFLDKLMEIIHDNYQDATFDVAELIEKMHMSKSLLHRKLHSLIGQPAVKIIRSYRLSKAKELIEIHAGGRKNISEIAYEVGFNDPKYFTRCFTKQYGSTPSSLLDKH